MKFKLFSILILILAGCTSIPTSMSSQPITTDRLLLNSKKDAKNSAEIIVVRDRSMSGAGCYYAIFIDNKLAARIAPSEKATFNLTPGQKQLKITRDPQGQGLCSSGDDMTEEKVALNGSDKKYFRLSTTLSGWPDLQTFEPSTDKF